MRRKALRFSVFMLALLVAAGAFAQQASTFNISGVTYTKWLWGNQRTDGSLYNFTTVPGEGWGDNGQGTELELLVSGKPNRYLEVSGRIHSRFSQNFWTNFGGFGGSADAKCGGPNGGGDCGEFDPRSNQYVKLRGLTVRVTPGFKYLDSLQFGATDLGMFDPFTMGKIRYIDRDNLGAILAQGSLAPNVRYDAIRVSLPRLWAGPGFNTGSYASQDSAYGLQIRANPTSNLDLTFIGHNVRDIEVDAKDILPDNGRDVVNRYNNDVYGVKADFHPAGVVAVRGAFYHSSSETNDDLADKNFFGISGFSPVPAGSHDDNSIKLNVDVTDPFGVGLSFNAEYFNIGAEYVSILAARRESDVLLTEGHDSTWAFPGPSNGAFGVFGGNESRIGYGGWQGHAQQVATVNVDNEFTDFDEPMAETVIGWKGITIVPRWQRGALEIAAELTHIDYNTNWQAWDDDTRPVLSSLYPSMESDTGVGHNFRSAYVAFQDKTTDIGLIRAKTTVNFGKGVDVFGKLKMISESDKRLNDAKYLPYKTGDCAGGTTVCKNAKNFYFGTNTTADLYGNPEVITGANGVKGYQWKPFNDIRDDDRDLDYTMVQLGAGYQLTDVIYGSLTYEKYMADLKDGNTAFQAYQLHEMASGEHNKNKFIALLRFPIGGAEAGFNYEYTFGDFDPDFGTGFVPQLADAQTAKDAGVKEGSRGFKGRFGGWNSLENREFSQNRLKAYFKVRF